jgi:hypothetical protein
MGCRRRSPLGQIFDILLDTSGEGRGGVVSLTCPCRGGGGGGVASGVCLAIGAVP